MSIRADYCRSIQQTLIEYCASLAVDSSGNLQDESIYAEDIFCAILNSVYDFNLRNANQEKQNTSGYDLVDEDNHLLVQVTKDKSSGKITSTLEKVSSSSPFEKAHLQFLLLVERVPDYRAKFSVPTNISFEAASDIMSVSSLMTSIRHLDIQQLRKVHNLVVHEIGYTPDVTKIPTCLGRIVRSLAPTVFTEKISPDSPAIFKIIEKINANDLQIRQRMISEYAAYTHLLTDLYHAYDVEGASGGRLLLQSLADDYDTVTKGTTEPVDIFDTLVEVLLNRLENDASVQDIDFEMRRCCAIIILVDAFMRCRIFKGPDVRLS